MQFFKVYETEFEALSRFHYEVVFELVQHFEPLHFVEGIEGEVRHLFLISTNEVEIPDCECVVPADDLIYQPVVIEGVERGVAVIIIEWFIEVVVFSDNENIVDIGAVDCEYSFIQKSTNCEKAHIPVRCCCNRVRLSWKF